MTHGVKYLAGLVLAVGMLAAPICAYAVNRYGVIGLSNDTEVAINFQYRVGDGPWQSRQIRPGEKLWFAHRYEHADEDRSPEFLIRFDSDLRSARFDVQYKLQRRAAVGEGYEYGTKYAFRYDRGDRRFVDLKHIG